MELQPHGSNLKDPTVYLNDKHERKLDLDQTDIWDFKAATIDQSNDVGNNNDEDASVHEIVNQTRVNSSEDERIAANIASGGTVVTNDANQDDHTKAVMSESKPTAVVATTSGESIVSAMGKLEIEVSPEVVPVEDRNEDESKLQSLFSQMNGFVKGHKIMLARQALKELDDAVEALTDEQKESKQVQVFLAEFRDSSVPAIVKKEAQAVQNVMKEIESDENWDLVSQDKKHQMRTYARFEEGINSVSIKVVAESIDCPVFNLIALMNEVDLLSEVFKYRLVSVDIELLKQVALFRKVVHAKIALPWPFAGRDIVCDAQGTNLLEQGAIVIVADSLEESTWEDMVVPESPKGFCRIDLHWSGGVLRPLNEQQTSLSAVFNIDFRLSFVPQGLINFFTQKLALPFLKMFASSAVELPQSKEHLKRIAANPEFYDEILRSVAERFQKPVVEKESDIQASAAATSVQQKNDKESNKP